MNRPTSIRIMGIDIPVTEATAKEDPALDSKLGYADHCRSRIVVNRDYSETPEAAETVLHEVVHSIDHALRLDFSEDTVGRLTRAFYGMMRDNPEFVRYLMEH